MFSNDFFEFLNLYLVLMDAIVLVLLTVYLLKHSRVNWFDHATQIALALGLYVGGHGVIRGWTWFWRFSQSHGWLQSINVAEASPVIPVGLVMTTAGLVWLSIRLYGTASLRLWVALTMLCAAIAAAVGWLL